MADTEELYPVMDGVIMQPGVRVFCDDRDSMAYDFEGTIVAARRVGAGRWEFDVRFGSGDPMTLDDRQIWPDASEPRNAPPPPTAIQVFLCHGKEDKEAVRTLYSQLRKAHLKPWLDEVDLRPGVEWEPAIRDAVRESDVILVCLSKVSTTKTGFVQKEIRIALDAADERPEGAVYIIPTKLEDCELPRRLARWQAVNLYEPGGLARLLNVLEGHPSRRPSDAEASKRTYWRRRLQ